MDPNALTDARAPDHGVVRITQWGARTLVALLFLAPAAASAQQHQHERRSPYAEHEDRAVKALAEDEVAGLLAGDGMGMALPAELNGYPGPRHVLDLATELELSAAQRSAAERIYDAMRAEAARLGAAVVELEERLDAGFAGATITAGELGRLLEELGEKRGALRRVHLQAHLELYPILTAGQRERYARLRGYGHDR